MAMVGGSSRAARTPPPSAAQGRRLRSERRAPSRRVANIYRFEPGRCPALLSLRADRVAARLCPPPEAHRIFSTKQLGRWCLELIFRLTFGLVFWPALDEPSVRIALQKYAIQNLCGSGH